MDDLIFSTTFYSCPILMKLEFFLDKFSKKILQYQIS